MTDNTPDPETRNALQHARTTQTLDEIALALEEVVRGHNALAIALEVALARIAALEDARE